VTRPAKTPHLVYADLGGNINDFPDLAMAGRSNSRYQIPDRYDLIELPEGSELFILPGRLPVGCDPQTGEPLLLEEDPARPRETIQAVAAFMAPAHTAILNSAYQTRADNAPLLPLFAYTSVGWLDGRFWVTAFRSDTDARQDFDKFSPRLIEKRTRKRLEQFKDNRLVQHLGKCCLVYCCPAARNYFLGRWEAPLPTSPTCNARCVGCISLQPSGCCPSTQDRITFVPTPKEIAQIAVEHLENAPQAIVSFGQGCEGEPLLQAGLIDKAIRMIRRTTGKGTINLNSNSSLPDQVEHLAKAGLDSLRVSLNSCQEKLYSNYYRPKNYRFADVKNSIRVMKKYDRFVSLNYFILPGVTDSHDEFDALCNLLSDCRPDLIQLRNLNMDPEWYLESIQFPETNQAMGIRNWLKKLKKRFPSLQFGYYNPPLR